MKIYTTYKHAYTHIHMHVFIQTIIFTFPIAMLSANTPYLWNNPAGLNSFTLSKKKKKSRCFQIYNFPLYLSICGPFSQGAPLLFIKIQVIWNRSDIIFPILLVLNFIHWPLCKLKIFHNMSWVLRGRKRKFDVTSYSLQVLFKYCYANVNQLCIAVFFAINTLLFKGKSIILKTSLKSLAIAFYFTESNSIICQHEAVDLSLICIFLCLCDFPIPISSTLSQRLMW